MVAIYFLSLRGAVVLTVPSMVFALYAGLALELPHGPVHSCNLLIVSTLINTEVRLTSQAKTPSQQMPPVDATTFSV